MGSKSPVFPISEPQHFSDYGFDPQMDYFQVLEGARKHKRENSTSCSKSIETTTIHFKLQKPISKELDHHKKSKKRRWWWKNAILYIKSKFQLSSTSSSSSASSFRYTDPNPIKSSTIYNLDISSIFSKPQHSSNKVNKSKSKKNKQQASSANYYRRPNPMTSISGPIYVTESLSGSSTPCRSKSRPTSGPLAGTMSPKVKGDVDVPYFSLEDLNMVSVLDMEDEDEDDGKERGAGGMMIKYSNGISSRMPIYLVDLIT